MRANKILIVIFISLIVSSCSLVGIHLKVENPRKAGRSPKFSKETILLGEMTHYRSCYDVKYYDFSLSVYPETKELSGVVRIDALTENDFDTLQIDLHENFQILDLNDGENKLNYYRKERAVFVIFSKRKGDKFSLTIVYKGKPKTAKKAPWKGGFVWKKDKEKNPWIGVACESDGASLWWPLKDHTADEPDSVRLHYSVPKGLTAVGNGQLEKVEEGNKWNTFHWFVSYPINTYNITLYVGKYALIEDNYEGISGRNLLLNHYVLSPNVEKAKSHFQQLKPILKCFEEKFGEYPWYNDGFKLVESPYAGMEHQTAIAYGNGYKNEVGSTTDYIILHETAHEWWGNSVTARDLADVWIQEGFATYAEALFYEWKDGKSAYESKINLDRIFIKNKYPVVGIKDRRWFHFRKNSDVYMKGSLILHSLRQQIKNDTLFFDIIETFSKNNKYKVVDSNDFIKLVNEKTGSDYNWFFNQYLFNNQVPILEYAHSPYGVMYYRWTCTKKNFVNVKVKVETFDGEIEITPSNEVQSIALPVDSRGAWKYRFLYTMLFGFEKNNDLLPK